MSRPTDTELCLLRQVWANKRLSAREIHDQTVHETRWSYSSTRKTLDRMVEKGLLRVEAVHGMKTFLAAQGKLQTMASLISDFSRNILGSDKPIPAAAFSGSTLLNDDEIAELEALLESLQETEAKTGRQND